MNDNLNNNMNDMQNIEQNDYYNNDSYYTNDNYDNNYSDTTYEEKEKKNGIWWKILLVILVILIIIFLLLKFCGNGGKKSKDELYAELTTKICDAAETYVMNNPSVLDRTEPGKTAIIKFNTLANANLISAQIENPYYDGGLFSKGTQPKYYSMDNSVRLSVLNDGTLNCEMVDNANDVTAPELRLNGDAEITLALGTDFEDPGYTATDDYDGDITDKVAISGSVDSKKAGTYELTYTVQDSAGNVTTKKRKIIYEEYPNLEITLGSVLDGVTPQISLKGSNPYCMVKGTQYVEPGAVATDNVDGNITDRISVTNKVTGNLMGSFRVVYKVEDSSGNQAIAYRAVIVTTSCPEEENPSNVVNTKPTITLIGKTSVTINIGSDYIDLGASAYDKEDGDITSKIVTDTSMVNTKSAGIYKVTYRVTDSGGLTSTTTRTVTVKQAVSGNPVVRFTEDKKNVEVLVGKGNDSLITAPKAVNENGVAVAVTTRIEDFNTKEEVSTIDWTKAGKYRVIYTAIHGNGSLKQTKSIVVTILDEKVTIGGKDAVNVTVRSDNCDINEADLVKGGVTFTTTSAKTPIITLSGNSGNACKIGTYEVTVEASIDNGPTTKKNITVYVVNGDAGQTPVGAPSKVTITGNTANPSNVYNTNNVWAGGAVTGITISFASTPASGSEIAHFEYSKDCSTVTGKVSKLSDTTGTLTWTEEGSASVCIRAVTTTNVAGSWSDPVKLLIDRTGPEIQFTHTWASGENDWHNTPTLTVEYKATDSESGLDHFEYTYDDVKGKKAEDIVTYNEATGKLTVSEDTEPTRTRLFVYVRAVDKAGNKGEWTAKPAFTNIDTVKPNAPIVDIEGDNTDNVKIKVSATDGSSARPSGIAKYVYTISDGGTKEETTNTIQLPKNTTNEDANESVKVWAVDKAGNKSENYSTANVVIKPAYVSSCGLSDAGLHIDVKLPDGLIPVVIDEKMNVKTVDKNSDKWYNYSCKEWANAILVTEQSRSKYLNKPDVEVNSNDVLAYFVYIPRYKFKVFNSTKNPTNIDIVFEYVSEKSAGSSIGSYMTHPGFTFGSQELAGIWFGKYETKGTSSIPKIVPEGSSLKNQNLKAKFETSLKFAGGTLSNYVVSFAGSTTYGLGSNVDTHVSKDPEWGAVAYLSASKYGLNGTLVGSTTGNSTGVYDMASGEVENVMSYYGGSIAMEESEFGDRSGFDRNITKLDSKYYNIFASNSGSVHDVSKCGTYCLGFGLFNNGTNGNEYVYTYSPWGWRSNLFYYQRTQGKAGLAFRTVLVYK